MRSGPPKQGARNNAGGENPSRPGGLRPEHLLAVRLGYSAYHGGHTHWDRTCLPTDRHVLEVTRSAIDHATGSSLHVCEAAVSAGLLP